MITAAAAVMIVVFASFAAGDDRVLKLFGISTATAVFLDALAIRTILLPAVLQLLGRSARRLGGPRSSPRRPRSPRRSPEP
jgi:putative drug exporter of the RND superfamily